MTDDEMFARRRMALEISVQAGWKPTPAEVQEWLWPAPAKVVALLPFGHRRKAFIEMAIRACSVEEIRLATGMQKSAVYQALARYRKSLGIPSNPNAQKSGRASQVAQAAKRAAAAAH